MSKLSLAYPRARHAWLDAHRMNCDSRRADSRAGQTCSCTDSPPSTAEEKVQPEARATEAATGCGRLTVLQPAGATSGENPYDPTPCTKMPAPTAKTRSDCDRKPGERESMMTNHTQRQ